MKIVSFTQHKNYGENAIIQSSNCTSGDTFAMTLLGNFSSEGMVTTNENNKKVPLTNKKKLETKSYIVLSERKRWLIE